MKNNQIHFDRLNDGSSAQLIEPKRCVIPGTILLWRGLPVMKAHMEIEPNDDDRLDLFVVMNEFMRFQ